MTTGDIALSGRQRERVHALLSESDSLRIFLRDNIVPIQGASLTVAEIVQGYNQFAIDNGWSPLPIAIVQRQLEDLMMELFSTPRSNCVKRDGKDQRGFFNVRFRMDSKPADEETDFEQSDE